MASFMSSREGMTQGDHLSRISYNIYILILIKNLKQEIPDIIRPWYADDSGTLGMFAIIETYFNSLTCQGLGCGYHPELSKSVLTTNPENPEAGKEFGVRHIFKVCTCTRYLGGYTRDDKSKSDLLRERTLMWEKKLA